MVTRYPLNRQDPEMRDSVGKEVEGLVRKGYEAFAARCQSKGAEKCEYTIFWIYNTWWANIN